MKSADGSTSRTTSPLRHLGVLALVIVVAAVGSIHSVWRSFRLRGDIWSNTAIADRIRSSPAIAPPIVDCRGVVVAEPVARHGRIEIERHYAQAMAATGVGYSLVLPIGVQGHLLDKWMSSPWSGPWRWLLGDNVLAPPNQTAAKTTLCAKESQAIYELLATIGRHSRVVVMEVNTASIVAAVDWPGPDASGMKAQTSRASLGAFMPVTAPGSLWKCVTAAYIYETGAGDANAVKECDGRSCPVRHGTVHGIEEATAVSCNGWFLEQARRFNRKGWQQFVLDVGATPVGVYGMPPSTAEIRFAGARADSVGWMAIGQQTFLSLVGVTCAYRTLVTGTRMSPRIVDAASRDTDSNREGVRVLSSATAAAIRHLLFVTAERGTARVVRQVFTLTTVGGKTGTAQTDPGSQPNSLFVAVAPIDRPRWIVSVEIVGGGAGTNAGLIAGRVLNMLDFTS